MVWMLNQQVTRGRRSRIGGVAFLCWLFIMLVTPKIPLSYRNHLYADMRNFLGIKKNFFLFYFISIPYAASFLRAHNLPLWVSFVFVYRSSQHVECDHQFPFFDCGCSGVCSLPGRRRLFQYKVFFFLN